LSSVRPILLISDMALPGWRLRSITDNSDLFIRCPPLEDSLSPAIDLGYEIQIDDRGYDPKRRSVGSSVHLTEAVYGLRLGHRFPEALRSADIR
jgi:hypothetical protein